MPRWASRVDQNQLEIVDKLRAMGFSVAPRHDDILVGYQNRTFWFEIKRPTKTGKVKYRYVDPAKCTAKKKQQDLKDTWRGHYRIVTCLNEILADLYEGQPK